MKKIVRLYALAALAVFGAVLVGGIFHNLAVGAVAGIGLAAAFWFAGKYIDAQDA